MNPRRLFWIGAVGTVITALCCFTPLLVIGLTSLGFVGAIAYLDMILLPLLGIFALLLAFALMQKVRSNG